MPNINKNIIMQAGAAVANATTKAAGLSAATPEPGSIISTNQLVNGGRKIGPDALAHFTESVRNKLLSLLVSMEPIQSGSGTPSPDNVRPISGRTGLSVYVSPTQDVADATTYAVDWTSEAGTVYGGHVDLATGELVVDRASVDLGTLTWLKNWGQSADPTGVFYSLIISNIDMNKSGICTSYAYVTDNPNAIPDKSFTMYGSGRIYVKDTSYDDATNFKTAVSGVIVVYELATPLTYQLTAQDIITLVGDNYIWSDSGDVTITE